MEEETKGRYIEKSYSSKQIRKNKSRLPVDIEADKRFDELKRKYANAVAFLLVKNISRLGLREYFYANEDNQRRFSTIKKFRQQIIESRPKAKIWVDKPFYLKLDISDHSRKDDGTTLVSIVLGECTFKQPTAAVGSKKELELYLETIAKIIDSEKVWADPDMADFDIGEREYNGEPPAPPPSEVSRNNDETEQLNLNSQH